MSLLVVFRGRENLSHESSSIFFPVSFFFAPGCCVSCDCTCNTTLRVRLSTLLRPISTMPSLRAHHGCRAFRTQIDPWIGALRSRCDGGLGVGGVDCLRRSGDILGHCGAQGARSF